MNVYDAINKLLRAKGNIIKVRFSVGDKPYEAYVPDDEYWGSIKDVTTKQGIRVHTAVQPREP
jgi:hypothetical protein